MTTWSGAVTEAYLQRLGGGRRRIVLDVVFRVVEDGRVKKAFPPDRFTYPVEAFEGMTLAQFRDAVLDDGVGGQPPLRNVGAAILVDWQLAEVLRGLPLPYRFEP